MKHILSSVIVLLFVTQVYSQTEKGSYTLGGDLTISTNHNYWGSLESDLRDHFLSFNCGVSPTFGTFVIDNLLVGITPSFLIGFSGTEDQPGSYSETGNSNYRTYGIGTYATKYFGDKAIKPFVGISLGYNRRISSNDYTDVLINENTNEVLKSNYLNSTVSGGLTVFTNKNLSLNLFLQYSLDYRKKQMSNSNSYQELSNRFALGSGVSFYFSDFCFKRD